MIEWKNGRVSEGPLAMLHFSRAAVRYLEQGCHSGRGCLHRLNTRLNSGVRNLRDVWWEYPWITGCYYVPATVHVFLQKPSLHHSSVLLLRLLSLQSCPTLCDPIDGSPPGCPVPGILQARTPEWVAISFSNAWKWKVKVKSLSHEVALCDPMDCSLPGSSVHGILLLTYIFPVGNNSLVNYFLKIPQTQK